MSRGKYAGQPLTFCCAKCRLSREHFDRFEHPTDRGRRFRLTGRTRRRLSDGANMHRWGSVAYEYECLDCGHRGWSRHPDVARWYTNDLARAQGVQTPDEVAAEDATWD